MPISMALAGQAYTVRRVSGASGLRAHLQALGFSEGAPVELVSNRAGNVILRVRDARIAINAEEARHIYV